MTPSVYSSSRSPTSKERRLHVVGIKAEDPVVHLITCGHPPPLLLRGDRLTPPRAPQWAKEDPDELLRLLQDDLLAHVHDHLNDDAAVVAIRRLTT